MSRNNGFAGSRFSKLGRREGLGRPLLAWRTLTAQQAVELQPAQEKKNPKQLGPACGSEKDAEEITVWQVKRLKALTNQGCVCKKLLAQYPFLVHA